MGKSNIEWLNGGKTWNPIRARNRETGKRGWYCQKVSKLCAGCYAETRNVNTFFGNGIPYAVDKLPLVELYLDEKVLEEPLHWKKPCLIFPCSMTDIFGEFFPIDWTASMYAVMALSAHWHTYQVLTKRAERRLQFFREHDFGQYIARARPKNIWEGSSVGTQEEADRDIPILLQTPAALRWLSMEPLLERVQIKTYAACHTPGSQRTGVLPNVNWVVTGGESGPKARPSHPDWFRSLRDQCRAANVPFFFKQWGQWEIASHDNGHRGHIMPDTGERYTWLGFDGKTQNPSSHGLAEPVYAMAKVGKKAAGRLLDGKEYSEYPEVGKQ